MYQDASGDLHALLIGVDGYLSQALPDGSSYPPLGGCVRDIRHVEAFLLDRLGLPRENVVKLTASRGPGGTIPEPENERPSYANIVAKFKEVTGRATSGDRVYIHYSGHGGRTRTAFKELKGEDGLDEGLVPYDIATNGVRYLRDIEMAHLLKQMADKGLIVTFCADCCHSGGATRGVSTATARGIVPGPAGFDTRDPPTDSAVAPLEELTRTWAAATRKANRGASRIGDWLSETRGYTLLAACRANEFAYEDSFDGKERNGALTYWLLDSLRSIQPNTTYKELHDRILAKIRSAMENQTPELQGEGDLVVFGSNRITPVYAVPILDVDAGRKRVKLNAGDAHGIGVGALLAAYALGERDLAAVDKRQALLMVTDLEGDTDSWASITEDYGRGPVEQGGQAVLLGSTDLHLQRVVGVSLEDAALRQAIETAIAGHGAGFIRLRQADESIDFQVALNPARPDEYEIWDRAGVVVPNLRPAITIDVADAAVQVVRRLVHLAKFRRIQELSSPDPLAGKIKVEITDVPAGRASGSLTVLAPRERFKLKITSLMQPNAADINDKSRILNITVLDLEPNWQIEQIVPNGAGAFELLQPGETKEQLLEAWLPDGYGEAADIFKVFATQRTSGFRCLELPALDQPPASRGTRGAPSSDPLEALLEAFTDSEAPQATEIATRQVKILSDPQKRQKAWAVAQVEVRVRRNL